MSASGGQHCPGPHQCAAWTLHRVEVLHAAESIWQRRDVGTYMRAPFVTAAVTSSGSSRSLLFDSHGDAVGRVEWLWRAYLFCR